MLRDGLAWLMDNICADWNGHMFLCWNRPQWVTRVWCWACRIDL